MSDSIWNENIHTASAETLKDYPNLLVSVACKILSTKDTSVTVTTTEDNSTKIIVTKCPKHLAPGTYAIIVGVAKDHNSIEFRDLIEVESDPDENSGENKSKPKNDKYYLDLDFANQLESLNEIAFFKELLEQKL